MPQNRETGAAGNTYGHEMAPKIAAAIGATMTRPGSNEVSWNGQRAVIKSARKGTSSVGVTYSMLETLDVVIGAFQHKSGAYEVYTLPARLFGELAADSRSSGAQGRVGVVARKTFLERGLRIKVARN